MERRHACFRLVWQAPRDFRLRGKRQLFLEEAWEEEEQADSDEEEEVLPTEEGVDEPSSTSIGSTAPPFCNIVQVPFVLPFTSHSSKSLSYSASNVNSPENHYNVEIAIWPQLVSSKLLWFSLDSKICSYYFILANFKYEKVPFWPIFNGQNFKGGKNCPAISWFSEGMFRFEALYLSFRGDLTYSKAARKVLFWAPCSSTKRYGMAVALVW